MIDTVNRGAITLKQIKDVFCFSEGGPSNRAAARSQSFFTPVLSREEEALSSIQPALLYRLVAELDEQGDGKIQFETFCCLMIMLQEHFAASESNQYIEQKSQARAGANYCDPAEVARNANQQQGSENPMADVEGNAAPDYQQKRQVPSEQSG